jgi:hypothetical protein
MSTNNYLPLAVHKDNPFKELVEGKIFTTTDSDNGMILDETVTITRRRQYMRGPWVRLTQNKEVLMDLSPWGWKILGHIALHMEMNMEKIKISRRDVGADKRMFSRVMLELLSKRIIANAGKREWYWINISLLIMGTINKHEE